MLRPTCAVISIDLPAAVTVYSQLIFILLPNRSVCQTPELAFPYQILRSSKYLISFYAQSEFAYLARVFFEVLLFFCAILCTMVPYLVLASWKVVGASGTTAGLNEFSGQSDPVWDFVLSHASGFAKWTAQPRKPHLGML